MRADLGSVEAIWDNGTLSFVADGALDVNDPFLTVASSDLAGCALLATSDHLNLNTDKDNSEST